MRHDLIRHYVVLKATDEVMKRYFDKGADDWAARYIADHIYGRHRKELPFSTAARPSDEVYFGTERPKERSKTTQEVVVALNVFGSGKQVSREVVDDIIKATAEKQD